MPTTRKKVIKTVYKDEDDSVSEGGDFSDSGSEAHFSEHSESSDEHIDPTEDISLEDDFKEERPSKSIQKKPIVRKKQFVKKFMSRLAQQNSHSDDENEMKAPTITVKDLTDADKLLPSVLNLSESDSSDDESPKSHKAVLNVSSISTLASTSGITNTETTSNSDDEITVYNDVWSKHLSKENSEEISQKCFDQFHEHTTKIEQTKASLAKYQVKNQKSRHKVKEADVTSLLAQGEEVLETKSEKMNMSDSDVEDWEEVKESKASAIPQSGLQLIVDFPGVVSKKSKPIDVEMMMKRKINRVKKEYQVYMHKVHVLSWIAHGNFVNSVVNDQEVLAASLSLVPSEKCYPGDRVDIKYLEQVTRWYTDKIIVKLDKNADKFKPKAPPLKDILLKNIKERVVHTKKHLVFIFVAMLRALGIKCRIMFNFVTVPLRPPSSELCSLKVKPKEEDKNKESTARNSKKTGKSVKKLQSKTKTVSQIDGTFDDSDDEFSDMLDSETSDEEFIVQLDGNNDKDSKEIPKRKTRAAKNKIDDSVPNEDVSPPKQAKTTKATESTKRSKSATNTSQKNTEVKKSGKTKASNITEDSPPKKVKSSRRSRSANDKKSQESHQSQIEPDKEKQLSNRRKTPPRFSKSTAEVRLGFKESTSKPKIIVTDETGDNIDKTQISVNGQTKTVNDLHEYEKPTNNKVLKKKADSKKIESNKGKNKVGQTTAKVASKFFDSEKVSASENSQNKTQPGLERTHTKTRTRSAPEKPLETSKYFKSSVKGSKLSLNKSVSKEKDDDKLRVSHRDLSIKSPSKTSKKDVTKDLIDIVKKRVSEAKADSRKKIVKVKQESDCDSDFLPEEEPKERNSDSDNDFKPTKISPRSRVKKIDRRVISSDDESVKKKLGIDVWCEVYVEEEEQWITVDVVKGQVHCVNEIYGRTTHPVAYIVGWDNNNYLKDLTRRYVPQWNTVTRKLRAEPAWWQKAIAPWLGPKTPKDKEEDEQLDRMQLDAPLPKSIGEYKNHPLYALKRHLLKFEAIYPSDAPALGFVRNEPVYARECVYTCRSRDIWLKEARVVKLGEQPYKIVKSRPKWDKLSNKLITDKPLEIFGIWQTQDYEPPTAENGIVPRNPYGNVELFKTCMLPKKTVHIKLPGLNKVAKKLNIDCAPAMTGFDFHGGWSHPVYDGFVVCEEFEELITDAWVKDQEEMERKEREKIESRVYGNWRKLIRGLFIRERLKAKYAFDEPEVTAPVTKKGKGPRLVVKKK